MNGTPLEQMVYEALQVCPEVWKRDFPTELIPTQTWDTYTRCVTFMIGGVYPDSTWDRPEMAVWSALLSTVRERLTTAAELHDYQAGRAAMRTALQLLAELQTPVQDVA